MVYFPFDVGTGVPVTTEPYVYTQTTPDTPWTITHHLGYNPSVTVIIGGEEVDADVTHPDLNTVLVTFAEPQSGTARLI